MSRTFSIRLDDDTASKLDRLALALDRPQSWLIERAITEYVGAQWWQLEAVADALTAYRGGAEVLTPHDEVMDRVEARLRTEGL